VSDFIICGAEKAPLVVGRNDTLSGGHG
jgi:hypothetical protein